MKRLILIPSLALNVLGQDVSKTLDLIDKQEQQKYIQKEIDTIIKKSDNQSPNDQLKNKQSNEVFIFHSISFLEQNNLPKQIQKITQSYQNKPISIEDIYELIQKTTNYFISNGYTTTIVTIYDINAEKGYLILKVEYGYVNDIFLNGEIKSNRLLFGMPLKKHEKFNIFDLDTGLENLSNVSDNVQMLVKPSLLDGYSDIIIKDKIQHFKPSINIDNSGTEKKGLRASAYLTTNNFLGINDAIKMAYIGYPKQYQHTDKENIYLFNYTLPILYNQVSYLMQYLDVNNSIDTDSNTIINKTTLIKHRLSLKRILYRSQIDKLTSYITLDLKKQINKINNILLQLSSKQYTQGSIGLEYSTQLFNGFLYLNLEYQKGLPIFGAENDTNDSLLRSEFNKYNLNLSYQKNLFYNQNFSFLYKGNIAGSYSKQSLLNADKFSIGDEYTVRGFKKYSAALDYGIYSNNTIFVSFLNSRLLKNIQYFAGLDGGYGRDYLLPKRDILVGSSLGTQYNFKNLSITGTISKALLKTKSIPNESFPLYLKLNWIF